MKGNLSLKRGWENCTKYCRYKSSKYAVICVSKRLKFLSNAIEREVTRIAKFRHLYISIAETSSLSLSCRTPFRRDEVCIYSHKSLLDESFAGIVASEKIKEILFKLKVPLALGMFVTIFHKDREKRNIMIEKKSEYKLSFDRHSDL